MDKFARSLLTEWRRLGLPFEQAGCLVAVSGGADSVALLLAVEELRRLGKFSRLEFTAAHFDHGLRGAESERDAAFVRELCAGLGFACVSERGSVARRGNLEQNARRARYAFLRRAAAGRNAAAVLTAHTVNDQAETLLLNLLRGGGLAGLAAMRPVIEDFRLEADFSFESDKAEMGDRPPTGDRGPGNAARSSQNADQGAAIALVRPLLGWALREETENYCRARGVEYRRDAMNEDEKFARVRVRRSLLPRLAEFNPQIVRQLARTARVLRGDLELIEAALEPVAARPELSLREPGELPVAAVARVVRGWLGARRGELRGLGASHLAAVERLALSPKSGRTVELPGGGRVVKRAGALIYIAPKH